MIQTTFLNFCRKSSIFQVSRSSGIGNPQNSIKFLSCLIFGHFNTGKQFVNIRIMYQTDLAGKSFLFEEMMMRLINDIINELLGLY